MQGQISKDLQYKIKSYLEYIWNEENNFKEEASKII